MTQCRKLSFMKRSIATSLILLFFLCLCQNTKLYAQTLEDEAVVHAQLQEMFSSLDKTKVPTGLLLDYAVNTVDFSLYNGVSFVDSCRVNYPTFECILHSVRSSSVVSTTLFDDIETLSSEMDTVMIDDSIIPIGLAAFRYNYIVENAITDSLIVYDVSSNHVYDKYLNGNWMNPYSESKIIGFSPRVNFSSSRQVSFVFDSSFVFSNLNISYIDFDPGDGNGFRRVNMGSSVLADYPLFSTYTLRIRIGLSDSSVLLGTSIFATVEAPELLPETPSEPIPDPDYSFVLQSRISLHGYMPSARVSVKYASDSAPLLILSNPLIIVEGYEPIRYNSKYRHSYYYRNLGFNNLNEAILHIDSTVVNSRDIVYVDWLNSNAPIETNADIVKQVIQWVNTNKSLGSRPSIIIGESMGGLAVRYALRELEEEGYPHQVSTYVSYDSPHLGVNLPLGLFYAARFFLPIVMENWSSLASFIVSIFVPGYGFIDINQLRQDIVDAAGGYSVKQMAYHYVYSDMVMFDYLHNSWQQSLASKGFPQGDGIIDFANIAVSNGGSNESFNNTNAYATLDAHLSYGSLNLMLKGLKGIVSGSGSFWTNIGLLLLPQSKSYSFHSSVSPFYQQGNKVFEYTLTYTKRFLWFFSRTITVDSRQFYAPTYGFAFDTAKASYYELTDDHINRDIVAWFPAIGDVGLSLHIRPITIPFVPTVSSLCVGKGLRVPTDTEYQEDYYYSNYGSVLSRIPFHSYYINQNSSEHLTSYSGTYGTYRWIQEMDTLRISGPSTVVTGDTFSMTNPNLHPSWTSSDTSVATVSSYTGQVTVNSQGEFTLSCTGTGANYRPYHFEKSIHTAVFDYALSSDSPSGSMSSKPFVVRANSTTWDQLVGTPPNQLLHNNSGHRFYFSIHPAGSTAPITWSEESTPECFLVVQEGSASVVSFKAEYNGIYSDVISVVCHNPLEIPEFPIGGGGEIGPGGDDPIGPDPNPDPDPDPGELPDPDPDGVNSPRSSACTFYIEGEELSYSSMPSPQELLEDIKKIPSFWEKIGTVKPRGEKDFLIIPYQYLDKESGKKYDRTLKFIYRGK